MKKEKKKSKRSRMPKINRINKIKGDMLQMVQPKAFRICPSVDLPDNVLEDIRLSGISRGRFLSKESMCYPYF